MARTNAKAKWLVTNPLFLLAACFEPQVPHHPHGAESSSWHPNKQPLGVILQLVLSTPELSCGFLACAIRRVAKTLTGEQSM